MAREGATLQLTRLSAAIFDGAEDIEELTACAAHLTRLTRDDQWGLLCLKLGIFDEVGYSLVTSLSCSESKSHRSAELSTVNLICKNPNKQYRLCLFIAGH